MAPIDEIRKAMQAPVHIARFGQPGARIIAGAEKDEVPPDVVAAAAAEMGVERVIDAAQAPGVSALAEDRRRPRGAPPDVPGLR